jgi:hypothetical protein
MQARASAAAKPDPSCMPLPVLVNPRILDQVLRQPAWTYFDPTSEVQHKACPGNSANATSAAHCANCEQLRRVTQRLDLKSIARMRKWDMSTLRRIRRLLCSVNEVVHNVRDLSSCKQSASLCRIWQPKRVQTLVECEKLTPVQHAVACEWLRTLRALSLP